MRFDIALLLAALLQVQGSPILVHDGPVDKSLPVQHGHPKHAPLDVDPASHGRIVEKRVKKTTATVKTTASAKTTTPAKTTTSAGPPTTPVGASPSTTQKSTSSTAQDTTTAASVTAASTPSTAQVPVSSSQTAASSSPTTTTPSPATTSASQSPSVTSPITSTTSAATTLSSRPTGTATSTGGSCPLPTAAATTSAKPTARWLPWLRRRASPDYGNLIVPTDDSPGALDTWASTTVYPQRPREVAIELEAANGATSNVVRATSRFEPFGTTPFFMALTGLWECTSVVVTSHCGAYMAHFWQNVIDDPTYQANPLYFDAGAAAALQGDKDQQKEDQANYDAKQAGGVWDTNVVPDGDFVSLKAHTDCLNAANNVQAAVVAQGTSSGGGPVNPNTSNKLAEVVARLLGIRQGDVRIVSYKKTGSAAATARSNADGKVLLSYSPSTGAQGQEHAYQVRVKAASRPGTLVFGDTWTTGQGDSQDCCCTCPDETMPVKTGPVTSAVAQPGGTTGTAAKNRDCCQCDLMK